MAALLAPTRRAFLAGITAALAAPVIIRTPGLLMPVRPLPVLAPGRGGAGIWSADVRDGWILFVSPGGTQHRLNPSDADGLGSMLRRAGFM